MKYISCLIFLGLLCPTLTTTPFLHRDYVGEPICKWICKTMLVFKSHILRHDVLLCYKGKINKIPEDHTVTKQVKGTWMNGMISNTSCRRLSRVVHSTSTKSVCIKLRTVEGSMELRDKSIQYFTESLAFDDAKLKCKEEGGSLAQFQKGFNDDILKQIFVGKTFYCAWIDLTYHKELKQFKWGDGTPYFEEDRWSEHEPSHKIFGFGDENCVCLKKNLLLQDYGCTKRYDFICQI